MAAEFKIDSFKGFDGKSYSCDFSEPVLINGNDISLCIRCNRKLGISKGEKLECIMKE